MINVAINGFGRIVETFYARCMSAPTLRHGFVLPPLTT